jgi:hypothetical protein
MQPHIFFKLGVSTNVISTVVDLRDSQKTAIDKERLDGRVFAHVISDVDFPFPVEQLLSESAELAALLGEQDVGQFLNSTTSPRGTSIVYRMLSMAWSSIFFDLEFVEVSTASAN